MSQPSPKVLQLLDEMLHEGVLQHASGVGRAALHNRYPVATVYLQVVDQRIQRASFRASGCGYLIAACSQLMDSVIGLSVDESSTVSAENLVDELGGLPEDKLFCANLAVEALRNAIRAAQSH